MFVSARTLIQFALFIVIYTGFGGTMYILQNRLQELGSLFLMLLFAYSALLTALNVRDSDLRWSWWVLSTIVFICYAMLVPAFVFSANTGAPALPSIMSTRDFFSALLAPALYLSYRAGVRPQELEKAISLAFGAIAISYIFHYFRMDLQAAYNSPNPFIKLMITYDEWRGYRLKAPGLALIFGSFLGPILFSRAQSTGERLFWLVAFSCSVYGLILIQSRAFTAAAFLGFVLYHVWFARKNRLPLFYLGGPILAGIMILFVYQFFSTLQEHDTARYATVKQATEFLAENPLLGFGKDNETLREKQIMHPKFFSSDIGIVGAAFRVGIPATVFLVFMLVYALRRAITINWLVVKRSGYSSALLTFFILQGIGDFINISLSAVQYLKIVGILMVAMAIGLTAVYRHHYKFEKSAVHNNTTQGFHD